MGPLKKCSQKFCKRLKVLSKGPTGSLKSSWEALLKILFLYCRGKALKQKKALLSSSAQFLTAETIKSKELCLSTQTQKIEKAGGNL